MPLVKRREALIMQPVVRNKAINPPQDQLEVLLALYNEGQLSAAVEKAQLMVLDFPSSFLLWNIIGVANAGLIKLSEAEVGFRKAAELNPNYADAHYNTGNVLKDQGKLEEALEAYQHALKIKPDYADAYNNLGAVLQDQGKLEDALEAYQHALKIKPDYADAHNNMGNALQDQGKLEDAIEAHQHALKIKPDYADAYHKMGTALQGQGKLEAAIEVYQYALKIQPDYADVYHNMGNALQDQGKLEAAIEAYKHALKIKPDYADTLLNMGNALKDQGKLEDALEAYQQALKIKPDYTDAHNNMGNALKDQGKLEDDIEAYQRALKIKPDNAEAHNNMGNTLLAQGKLDETIEAFKCALKVKPDFAEAHLNMGNALTHQGKLDAAIEAYKRALKINSDYAEAHANMGNALKDQGKLDAAIEAYQRAIKIKPDNALAESQMLHQLDNVCDWFQIDLLNDQCERLGLTTKAVSPFALLSSEDNAERQLIRSRIWASENYKQVPLPLSEKPKVRPKLLKIGFFSADFHDHATVFLMAGLLRDYDNAQFEFFAYSYGRSTSGEWRQKAEQDIDHFFDVTDKSDHEIVDAVRSHGLDIAVDLKGYTGQTRSALFQYRLAPIQINYLGYPGSMGVDFIDYIIADPTIIPSSQHQHYSENVIYLPHSYQPNDDQRQIAQTNTTRADFRLPDKAFVFCCFNNNYKISPREFDIWMRILSQKAGSVLWLLKSNKWAEGNLCKEAQVRGIDPDRLVFAERLPHAEHLARHKHANLFIDTFNYNAHTTASDALWAGLPVITKQGNQFAARVAASLLNAVGLPELIATTEADYEALIMEFANNPGKLTAIKDKLAVNRLTQPLFDTKRYTRNFESGLQKVYNLYFEGEAPQDIWVDIE